MFYSVGAPAEAPLASPDLSNQADRLIANN